MHLDLPHLLYSGPALDDPEILAQLPAGLAGALRIRNGCVAYLGGFHVRGACRAPGWHSLRHAWEGADALHHLFAEVEPSDVPFAEDAFGDQFLLREGAVVRLRGELGELGDAAESLEAFFMALAAGAEQVLDYQPLLNFRQAGGELQPGQLLAAFPPFVLQADASTRQLRAVDALEQRRSLARLARRLHGLPDGAEVKLGEGAT
jgi:hypothetical protein